MIRIIILTVQVIQYNLQGVLQAAWQSTWRPQGIATRRWPPHCAPLHHVAANLATARDRHYAVLCHLVASLDTAQNSVFLISIYADYPALVIDYPYMPSSSMTDVSITP